MKRIICLTMALVMTFACVSAFAAQYDGLPEKMMLQMELSGLKGSVTLSATGQPGAGGAAQWPFPGYDPGNPGHPLLWTGAVPGLFPAR